jgi:hypothetical protein
LEQITLLLLAQAPQAVVVVVTLAHQVFLVVLPHLAAAQVAAVGLVEVLAVLVEVLAAMQTEAQLIPEV